MPEFHILESLDRPSLPTLINNCKTSHFNAFWYAHTVLRTFSKADFLKKFRSLQLSGPKLGLLTESNEKNLWEEFIFEKYP